MQHSANEGWQELNLPSRKECPKLFYSFHISKDSFALRLTDLISIWECSLDKYGILAEAARQQATIDPSESTHQFGVLLSKLRESLQGGQNSLVRDNSHVSQNLSLRTNVCLPRPLKPLDWTFHLEQKNASELAERLLRPSLHEVSVSQDKINSLLGILKDKDHVISRLLDRIGTSAIDLGLIFPGIAGTSSRKGGQLSVADARKHVAGMAVFDERSWVQQFSNDDGYEGADRTGLKNLVRGCEKCFVHTREQHEDWLNGLATSDKGAIKNTASKSQSQSSTGRTAKPISESGDEPTGSEDDFERQATPPNLQSKRTESKRTLSPASGDRNEADTEDDEPHPKKAKTTRIGKLGRRNATKAYGESKATPTSSSSAAEKSTPPRRSSPGVATDTNAEDATASSTATDSDTTSTNASSQRKKPRGHSNNSAKEKPRFGVLKKRPKEQSSPLPSSDDEPSAPPTSKSQRESRQGTSTPEPKADTSPAPSSHRRLGRLNRTEETRKTRSASSMPEDDDLDASWPPHTRSSQRPPPEEPTTPSRRLGRLGGRKAPTSSVSVSPQPPSSKKKSAQKSGEDVEIKDDGDRDAETDPDATPSPSPSPSPPTSTKPSTRQQQQQQEQPPPPLPGKTLPTSPSRVKKTNPSAPAPAPATEEEEKATEEETDEAKANRRREELKRSIASGAGVRKKRRF